jgi:hypothetical protein
VRQHIIALDVAILYRHVRAPMGFWLSCDQFLQGDCFFGTDQAMLRNEPNLPARSRKGIEAPIPRVGKGLPGFGIKRAPSRERVSALDHQATPAALVCPIVIVE